ncbi:unnamed protein product [marine sediment metagenome]|uniref:Uncharacterized protein n=1 Tax=marine sediment metagenome TaxID=412755 RepID=X1TGC1_9ZZZZ
MDEQFQRIFVINLPSRTDHRDAMTLAAALTSISLDFVDGVTEVSRRALPPDGEKSGLSDGALGSWRAHMNVIQT